MDVTTPEAATPAHYWRAPLTWTMLQVAARYGLSPICRFRVTGQIPDHLRHGPLILAINHISPFDPLALAALTRMMGIQPRIMATGGLFRAPIVGPIMKRAGHIRVDRRRANVGDALGAAVAAIEEGSIVLVYPEGRIGLDPTMYPERGKTGAARLAFASGAPVIPLAQWGSHEVLPYATSTKGIARGLARSLVHRPVVQVKVGSPIDLSDLSPGTPGAAQRATERIIEGISDLLVEVRTPDEVEGPRFVDPTKPADLTRRYRRRLLP